MIIVKENIYIKNYHKHPEISHNLDVGFIPIDSH